MWNAKMEATNVELNIRVVWEPPHGTALVYDLESNHYITVVAMLGIIDPSLQSFKNFISQYDWPAILNAVQRLNT